MTAWHVPLAPAFPGTGEPTVRLITFVVQVKLCEKLPQEQPDLESAVLGMTGSST